MNRREFTGRVCNYCLAGAGMSAILVACQSTHYVPGTLNDNGITVPASEFTYLKKDQPQTREYIVVRNDALKFPIYVYRFSEKEFSALLMKCTHQGTELQAAGDHLHCPAHGSEFNNRGSMTEGPADSNLRTFPVSVVGDQLHINLS
jgi:Rieske Fe-S protein